eukprot:XP_016656293.1 PREDICTED: uncharacterized protein LOC107882457 isoform X2 [Acyrthosiphon pisum]
MLCLSIVQRFCQIDGCRTLFAVIIYHTSSMDVKGYSSSSSTTHFVSCVCSKCVWALHNIFVRSTVVERNLLSKSTTRCASCVCLIGAIVFVRSMVVELYSPS